MKREIITTADGSKTIFIPEWNEQYHSKHGALQEARHVFLKTGLAHFVELYPSVKEISILEMGFGTGLNALITIEEAKKYTLRINYVGVEAFPITSEEVEGMDYPEVIEGQDAQENYKKLHNTEWEREVAITPEFSLTKRKQAFETIDDISKYDLIFFDAFGPRVQPELWTEEIFSKMYSALKSNGVMTTYCAQGAARRAMQSVGFTVERLAGPPGKREMLRASKL